MTPILLILFGIGLVGFYYFANSDDSPQAPVSKSIIGGVGIACFLFAAYLLYNTVNVWNDSPWYSICYLIFTVALSVAGYNLIITASKADAKAAADMKARSEAKAAEAVHREEQIRLETARQKSIRDAELEDERQKTQKAIYNTQTKEAEGRGKLVDTASDSGLDVNSLIGINSLKFSKDIEIQSYAKEKEIDFKIRQMDKHLEIQAEAELIRQQMEAADRVEHYKIVEQLENDLEDLMHKRRNIELNETDEVLKDQKVARLNKRIAKLEEDIDGRQDRLLSVADRKEIKGLN